MKRSRVWIRPLLGLVVIIALGVGTGSAVGLARKGIESAGRAAVQQQLEQQLQQHGVDRLAQDRDQLERQMEEHGVHPSTQDHQPLQKEAENGSGPSQFTIGTPGSVEMEVDGTCTADTTNVPTPIDMITDADGGFHVAGPGFSCRFP